jgi:hypothetical protein
MIFSNSYTLPNPAVEGVARAKAAYRDHASSLTWEEKVASIERMRAAATMAKKAMIQHNQQRGQQNVASSELSQMDSQPPGKGMR